MGVTPILGTMPCHPTPRHHSAAVMNGNILGNKPSQPCHQAAYVRFVENRVPEIIERSTL